MFVLLTLSESVRVLSEVREFRTVVGVATYFDQIKRGIVLNFTFVGIWSRCWGHLDVKSWGRTGCKYSTKTLLLL